MAAATFFEGACLKSARLTLKSSMCATTLRPPTFEARLSPVGFATWGLKETLTSAVPYGAKGQNWWHTTSSVVLQLRSSEIW